MIEDEMNNFTVTENGARTNATSGSALLDFFALGGALRTMDADKANSVFLSALREDTLLAVKIMFYFRDIREGQGQRSPFRTQLKFLADYAPHVVVANFDRIVEFGRWDDLFVLLDTQLKPEVIEYVSSQLEKDFDAYALKKPISLLAKWMKSENTSSKESVRVAKILRKGLCMTSKEYRTVLSELRAYLKVVEVSMSAGKFSEIEYDKVPSQAMLKYRKAFSAQDGDRFEAYLTQVRSGEKKINAGTLYPQQIVHDILRGKTDNADVLWDALPDFIGENAENSIAVVDTSGSMCGTPIEVALSLGIYLAERNKGIYKDKFITFSERPTMQSLKGDNIVEKVNNLNSAHWDMNTNIELVFQLILAAAIKNKIDVSEMVSKIYIISDMEFDAACSSNMSITLFQDIEKQYAMAGYTMPKLVFWNVDARNVQVPVTMNDKGVQLVSGYSPSIFKNLMKCTSLSAYELMMDVIGSERYSKVAA